MSDKDAKMMAYNAVERVCEVLGDVSTAQIWSKDRHVEVATARQLVMWYLWKICGLGYNEIGRAMGKNHATIMFGVNKADIMINSELAYDPRIRDAAEKLKDDAQQKTD